MPLSPVVDLAARRARGDDAMARVAAAPVQHVPLAFVAALLCVPVEDVDGSARPPLRAVHGSR
jgi:hypothetical protein